MNQSGLLNLLLLVSPRITFLKHLDLSLLWKNIIGSPLPMEQNLSRTLKVPCATLECSAFAKINFPSVHHKAWYMCVCMCVCTVILYNTLRERERHTIFTHNIVLESMIYFPKEAYLTTCCILIPRMLTFTLAISCLTTSNLSWFIDLTFQVPMQYCSLQHRTLLLSPVTSTTGCCFYFGSITSFFLELFLHWSPVAYWVPTDLGSSSFSFLSFCLFILFMEFSRQEYWSGLPFSSPVDHILSDLSTMTRPSWVAPHGMA